MKNSVWHISLSGNHQHSLSQMACTSPSGMSTLGGKDSICLLFRPLFTLGVRDCVPFLPVTVRSRCQRYLAPFRYLFTLSVRDYVPLLPVTVHSVKTAYPLSYICSYLVFKTHTSPSSNRPQSVSQTSDICPYSVSQTSGICLYSVSQTACPQSLSKITPFKYLLTLSVHTHRLPPFKYLLTLRYLFTLSVRHCIPLLPVRVSAVSRLLTPCHTTVHTQCYRLHASCSWDCSQCYRPPPFRCRFTLSVKDCIYLSFQ